MSEIRYHAAQSDGKIVQGTLLVDNPQELAQLLQKQGLFLISFSPVNPPAQEATISAPLPVVGNSQAESINHLDMEAAKPITPLQRLMLTLVFLSGLGIGLARIYAIRHPVISHGNTDVLNEKLARTRKGMTRGELEAIFTQRYAGNPPEGKTWYAVPPDMVVEIAYDNTGGQSNPQNHASDNSIRIFRVSDLK